MRGVRWLVALSVLPFACCKLDLRFTQDNVAAKKPNHVVPYDVSNLRKAPGANDLETTYLDPVRHVAPRATQPEQQEYFQIAEPVLTEHGLRLRGQSSLGGRAVKASCSKLLMVHSFAHSYYKPLIRNYQPPTCDFNRVVIKFEAAVTDLQYSRTGTMYFGDTLIWRTTTAESLGGTIHWTWQKDMTPFLSLWKKPQTLIFDLDNVVDEERTGVIEATITASFFKSDVLTGGHPPADIIIPITKGLKTRPSQFTVPRDKATRTVDFPQNANRAVFSVDAKGQGQEEFFWGSLPQSTRFTFPNAFFGGLSPWREIQVYLDKQPIGYVWPFPAIYGGGVQPNLNRPLIGIDVFDLREYQIDITPWLPHLCDGAQHTFAIRVQGIDDSKVPQTTADTGDSWYVSGKVFVWLDDEGSVTSGTVNSLSARTPGPQLNQFIDQDDEKNNRSLQFNLTFSREFLVSSWVKTQKHEGTVSWNQGFKYSYRGGIYNYGGAAAVDISTEGTNRADGSGYSFSTQYRYPLRYDQSKTQNYDGGLTSYDNLDQGLELSISGSTVFPTGLEAFLEQYDSSALATWRNGSFHGQYSPGQRDSYRSAVKTEQVFNFGGKSQLSDGSAVVTPLYDRRVLTVDKALKKDNQNVAGGHR